MSSQSSLADYYPVTATDLWPWTKGFFDKTADEITERNQKQSPLLRIPLDVRLIIYEYAMASDERIEMKDVSTDNHEAGDDDDTEATTNGFLNINLQAGHGPSGILRDGHGPKDMHIVMPRHYVSTNTLLGLCYACRQTRAETGPIMFAKLNSFGGKFANAHDLILRVVPNVLTVEQRSVVKSIWIETCDFRYFNAVAVNTLAEKFPNVQEVLVLESGW
jgi:hypothetical protein